MGVIAGLVGALLVLWVWMLAAGVYVGWRYVYRPWRTLRQDLHALAERMRALEAELGARRALDEETLAWLERRAVARRAEARQRLTLGIPPVAARPEGG